MKSLMRFYSSCGHVTTKEVTDALFAQLVANGNKVETDATAGTRIVVVYPWRFCTCMDCVIDLLDNERKETT